MTTTTTTTPTTTARPTSSAPGDDAAGVRVGAAVGGGVGLACVGGSVGLAGGAGGGVVGASVEGANVVGANVVGANVVGANVVGAGVEGAGVEGAGVEGAGVEGPQQMNSHCELGSCQSEFGWQLPDVDLSLTQGLFVGQVMDFPPMSLHMGFLAMHGGVYVQMPWLSGLPGLERHVAGPH